MEQEFQTPVYYTPDALFLTITLQCKNECSYEFFTDLLTVKLSLIFMTFSIKSLKFFPEFSDI